MATIELVDIITQKLDKGDLPLALFLDLSKAFDTLNHEILLTKLRHCGILSKQLDFFQSYLDNRREFVDFNDTVATTAHISTGVPQGSILGPLLFIIYINNMPLASNLLKLIIYGDDTTIITSFDMSNCTSSHINKELENISKWPKLNKLSLNIKKSKFMAYHIPQKKSFTLPSLLIM